MLKSRPVLSTLPQPILIGYSAKQQVPSQEWRKWITNPVVSEIASLSHCVSKPPEGWVERWQHNDVGLYDSDSAARSVCPEGTRFDLYAYAAIPLLFNHEGTDTLDLDVTCEPISEKYRMLGYDVVCWESPLLHGKCLPSFGCSPLSCNGMANHISVNQRCLVDKLELAIRLPRFFWRRKCEPGPYVIVQVWRECVGGNKQDGNRSNG